MRNFLRVTAFTISDELHYRSFYVLAIISVLFILMLRGCFNSDMMVNGQRIDAATVGWHTSIAAFHLIAAAGVLVGTLLAMRTFRRDHENGMTSTIMSKPVSRIQYIAGKTAGVWVLSYGLTFILHLVVYILMILNTGGRIEWYLPASLLISLNILFAVTAVSLFSLIMPDVIAALLGIVIGFVSFISDSLYAATQTTVVQSMMQQIQHGAGEVSMWRIIWPKLTGLQYFATSLIQNTGYHSLGPLHPAINVVIYCVLAFALLAWRFEREEIK